MEQKKETYNDLIRALTVMRFIDDRTPRSKVFYAMWLLENRALANGTFIYVNNRLESTWGFNNFH